MIYNFGEYKRLGEPSKKEKSENWRTAIGLQQVDGLEPSAYLIETAKKNIEGDITFDEVKERLKSYYVSRPAKPDDRIEEADKVSAHIAEILSEKTFTFSPVEYVAIHRRLFDGVYEFAGKIRDYNISKDEWVLDGKTVYYASADSIRATLDYDFQQEKLFDYRGLTKQQTTEHIAKFVSNIWQIHAFGEGNTRATAVFTIKYFRTFGFDVNNDLFAEHAWYFRNALVRASYSDYQNEVYATTEYLNRFFGNLLLGENNTLQNRDLHIAVKKNDTVKVGNDTVKVGNDTVKSKSDTVKLKSDTVKSGNDTVKVRNDTVKLGNDTVKSKSDTVKSKSDTVKSGNDTVKIGNDTVKSGNDTVKSGNDTVKSERDALNDAESDTVLDFIKKESRITAVEIASKLELSLATVKRHIKRLKENGEIERVGSDKTGYWEVKRNGE
jgi:fido (protein-threonine AMPylation protein)/ribosomal protein S25